jgi:histidinol-phosphate aminotransferase
VVTPSQANFLWLRTAKPAGELYEALKQRGILVRRGGRLSHQLRITIGTASENDELCQSLTELA